MTGKKNTSKIWGATFQSCLHEFVFCIELYANFGGSFMTFRGWFAPSPVYFFHCSVILLVHTDGYWQVFINHRCVIQADGACWWGNPSTKRTGIIVGAIKNILAKDDSLLLHIQWDAFPLSHWRCLAKLQRKRRQTWRKRGKNRGFEYFLRCSLSFLRDAF